MMTTTPKPRALGLCSGGLDSILAAMVLKDQGITVEWITFVTPFFSAQKAKEAALMINVALTVCDFTKDYLKMLKNPPCGYGKNMNPCMDCHTLMFRHAAEVMNSRKFDFLFSGEVLGQRPLSQTISSLRYVEKNSGCDGYIVRPLSAQKLPKTIPESTNKVDRKRLLALSGRSRKPQFELAKKYGINQYPSPAGGCLLTDKGFSMRLKDLFAHQEDYPLNALHLLKYGRHFRINPDVKLIVGRNHKENEHILRLRDAEKDTLLSMSSFPGPVGLLCGPGQKAVQDLAGAICAGYSKAPRLTKVTVNVSSENEKKKIQVVALAPDNNKKILI